MKLPAAVYRVDNLQRAWRWIRSNPDSGYKMYFRDHYSAYATAQEALIDDLSERLRRGAYTPAPACKLFLPKASGILRPYTLLSIEDQIVYQAAANVVAERLIHHVKNRYLKQVFGHLYAGKSSIWFYRKWSAGYAAFNKAATSAHGNGNFFTANFDLTAFYDSIDHRVLSHFLGKFGVDRDLIHSLCEWLSVWTGTDAQILQGHGIPQGPLSSGLIAETVLSHLDDHGWHKAKVIYLRYVDDIRLFAKTEFALRAALIRLDHLSKDIGLFPQSSKIGIHRVTDITKELKSVSQPVEILIGTKKIKSNKLLRRLIELSPSFQVENKTRFKFLLANATPRAELTRRLWKILDRSPELYESIARYLARSPKLPRQTSREVIRRIVRERLYPPIAAAFLRASVGSLHATERQSARTKFKKLWAPRARSPDFIAALGQWLLHENALSDRQIEYVCTRARSAWLRSSLILAVNDAVNSSQIRTAVARAAILDEFADPAICGAIISGRDGIKPSVKMRSMRRQAGLILKEFGLVRRAGGRVCGIQTTFDQILKTVVVVQWGRLFGTLYRQAERQIVGCRGYAATDATAWVQGLDVFNDLLLAALFRADPSLGGYTIGHIGAVTGSPSLALQTKFPHTLTLTKSVHEERYKSFLAHPLIKKSGHPTRRIPYGFISICRGLLLRSVREISAATLA